MPNHITTIISASPVVIKSILDSENYVDFEKLFPIPKIFERFGGGVFYAENLEKFIKAIESDHQDILTEIHSDKDVDVKLALLCEKLKEIAEKQNIKISEDKLPNTKPTTKLENQALQVYCYFTTGSTDPLEWNRNHFGTKWNAYNTEVINDDCSKVQFDTAWNHPFPIIKALSKLHPTEEISIEFADEDVGYNCGAYTILNEEVTEDTTVGGNGTEDDIRFACRILGYDPDEFLNDDEE